MSRSIRVVIGTFAVLAAAALLAGCAGSAGNAKPNSGASQPVHAAKTQSSEPVAPAPCASFGCRPQLAQPLTGGYAVRLWPDPVPAANKPASLSSTPVVELLHDGQHVSWWIGRLGYGWAASLKCLATPAQPNCVVLAELGAHAGSAEVLLLQDGGLVSPATATVVFDSGPPIAADLDHSGRLDVLGIENDYRPNYAEGHNYWASYRLVGESLRRTGCVPVTNPPQEPPNTMLSGPCPVVAQG